MKTFLVAIVALAIGATGGYYYGNGVGLEAGIKQGTEKAAMEATAAAQEAAVDAVNPFAGDNVLEDGYQNPFDGDVKTNPFE